MSTELALVRREVEIDAAPEVVWEFLTDPKLMQRWMGVAAELDPRPAGIYRVHVNGDNVARGEFVELTRHTRVVFTWGWEGSELAPGSSTVTVTLDPLPAGTRLTLVHSDLPAPACAPHDEGWAHYLARLCLAAHGDDPGRDPLLDQTP